jgi:hypothetical protein
MLMQEICPESALISIYKKLKVRPRCSGCGAVEHDQFGTLPLSSELCCVSGPQPRPDYVQKLDGSCSTVLQLLKDYGSNVPDSTSLDK